MYFIRSSYDTQTSTFKWNFIRMIWTVRCSMCMCMCACICMCMYVYIYMCVCVYSMYMIRILWRYAIQSGRNPRGPQVGPDRWLFAWPYHITTGYSFYPVQTNISLNNNSDGLKWQTIVYPCKHCNASQANSSISCLRVEGLSIYSIPQGLYPTYTWVQSYIYIYIYMWSYFVDICNRSLWNQKNNYRLMVCTHHDGAPAQVCAYSMKW